MILTSCQGSFSAILDLTPSSTPPASPEYGQAWLDSSTKPPTIKIWNGSAWVDQLGDVVEDLEGKFQDVTSKLSQAQKDILEQAGLIDSQGDLIAGNTAAIESHTETLSDHSAQIKANEDAIKLKVDTQTYTKDQSTINATISSNLSTAKSYAESQAASAKQAAITAAATDAQKKADAAKSAAISTAATDAQKKADAALSSAKTYTNAQISTVNTNLSKATSAIEVLQDQIALKVEQTDIDQAVTEVKLYADDAVETVLNTATEAINTAKSEIKQTTDSIKQSVTSLQSTVNTHTTQIAGKADTTTVKALTDRTASLETSVSGITGRVSSVESTVSTHTTQISGKEDKTIADTRNDNQNPGWYMDNYPQQVRKEFKYRSKIGAPGSTTYGYLETNTPWSDSSGGYPVQTFRSADGTFERRGTSGTAWSAWITVENTSGAQSKADAAKNSAISTAAADAKAKADAALSSAKTYTNTQITTVNKTITDKVAEIKATTDSITSRVSKTEQVAIASLQGKMLYTDPTFKSWTNSAKMYNNSANGTVTVTRVAKSSDCPTTSGYMLQIKTSGTASPGHGGFYFGTPSRANAIFLTKIIAKIPSGSSIVFASNNAGTGYKIEWLTSTTAGTGKWQEYICKVTCGSSGTFATTNYFYLNGGTAPITWYVAFATVWDVTETNNTESRLAAAEQKITADAIISTVQSTINTAKTEAINSANASTDTKLKNYSTTSQMNSAITQKADSITSTVSKTYATKDSLTGKVDKTSIISAINQTAESVKISASKIELTGKVTFSALDSATQSKINTASSTASTAKTTADAAKSAASTATSTANTAKTTATTAQSTANTAKTTADAAKTAATTAQSTANTVKTTVDSNKANWDKGLTAYNWTNSYGTRTNNLYTMVTKWTDGAVSATTEINGGWIKTNTITASRIAVGDWTNYATVNEHSQESMLPTSFKFGGTKRFNPSGTWELQRYDYTKSNYLMLCDYTPNCFKAGDKLCFQFQFYSDVNGTKSVAIYFYDSNKNYLSAVGVDFTSSYRTWVDKSITLSIGSIPQNTQYFILGFDMHNTTNNDVVRKCSVRKMMTGDMIVDGAITAAKIKVSDLSALNATIGGWTIGAHYLSTKVGSKYSVLKNDGDVAFATASPSASDTTGATLQIWHDGHLSTGDTKNSKTRSEIYGDRWNMYNDQGFAFRLVSAGGIEFYGDPSKNKTPYFDWHYNGDTGDYSVRMRCTGYDTLVVEGGSLSTGSDERLKKNIASMSDKYLALFDGLNPITFQYREHTKKTYCGFSAQEVERSATRAGLDISTLAMYAVDDQGYRSLAYQEFAAINTLAIKRNKTEIDRLKERMLAAEKRADTAEARLDQVQMLLNSAYALMAKHGIQQEM